MAERASLESLYTRKGIVGSNPTFSADESNKAPPFSGVFNFRGNPESFAFVDLQEN